MKQASRFNVHSGWKILMCDMGINPADVLTLAGLPGDLFVQKNATLSSSEFFAIWRSMDALSTGFELPLPLRIGQAISVEVFDPPIFACLCSSNLNIALTRLSQFKPLIGPINLDVDITSECTQVNIECYGYEGKFPSTMGAIEVVFFTALARLGTREPIQPIQVTLESLPENLASYKDYFGVEIKEGDKNQISFSSKDATRPFLTENVTMWQFFEAGLKQKLSDLKMKASTEQRVKSALLEMLPSGISTMDEAANRLAMSKRTLQRKLNTEETSFQDILKNTRTDLARHYLSQSKMSPGEISFLLGFQDSNSFIRAYNDWTGTTPGQYRLAH